MNLGHWLAVILLLWWGVLSLWQAIDNPVERTFNSRFYVVVQATGEVALVVLAALYLIYS